MRKKKASESGNKKFSPDIPWRYSIETKLIACFSTAMLLILLASIYLYNRGIELARITTYEKMYSQADYYLESLDNEVGHIRQLQIEFFNDRKLPFLVGPEIHLSDYEKRDGLLSMMERLNTVKGVSSLVEEGILYLPKSGYRITESQTKRMNREDFEDVERYLKYADGTVHYDGKNLFMVETGAPRIQTDSLTNHVFVIRFSVEAVKEKLESLNTSQDSGAFLFLPGEELLMEHSYGEYMGEDILGALEKEKTGEYVNTQRVRVGNENYMVFVGGWGTLGLFVMYIREEAVMEPIDGFRNLVCVLLMFMATVSVGFGIYAKRLIHGPVSTLLEAFRRVEEGNWKEHIVQPRKDEFSYLYNGFNEMEDRMDHLIEQVYVQTNLAQRAQMKQLQAQISPHFLYNSFFSLSRKIKRQDYDNAEALSKHLGTYFQYLTRNEADYVSLKSEVEHARSYSAIQAMRFIRRIEVRFEVLPEKYGDFTVPRLILQPLLENAFEHGLENKMKDGVLWVHFENSGEIFSVCVEDNGEDANDEKLEELSRELDEGKQGEITGIFNIHKRLQIYFGGDAGLRIERSSLGGVRMIIQLPENGMYRQSGRMCGT